MQDQRLQSSPLYDSQRALVEGQYAERKKVERSIERRRFEKENTPLGSITSTGYSQSGLFR